MTEPYYAVLVEAEERYCELAVKRLRNADALPFGEAS